jgi:hypothetical protein
MLKYEWRLAVRDPADWKSAIQQVGNLRYKPALADWKSAIQQVGNLGYREREFGR